MKPVCQELKSSTFKINKCSPVAIPTKEIFQITNFVGYT